MDPFLLTTPISFSKECRPRMPRKQELEAFRNFLKHVDTTEMASALQAVGLLDPCLDANSITCEEIIQILVFRDYSFVSVDDLGRRLFDHGFHRLASVLFRHFLYSGLMSNSIVTVKRSVPPNKKTIHIYFKNLKRLVHNAQFRNPREFFRKQARQLRDQIEREKIESRKQFLADKYIALLGAEIDAIAITYDSTLPDQNIFEELRSLASLSTDASISEVVFFGRKANALAIAKKFLEGEDMVKQAHCCANFTGPCLEIANMIYIDVYFKLWQFEQTPTNELKDALLYEGSKGLWALSEEEEEIRNLWKRMFLLRMIFCLLGLSNKGCCIPDCVISKEDVERAEGYMHEIDLKDIEARREMMYYIARARMQELKGLFYDASLEIDKASAIAHSGNFKEMYSIEEYRYLLKDLDSETGVKTICEENEDELVDAPALISLESLLESTSRIGTINIDNSCSSTTSEYRYSSNRAPLNDISIESSTYNTWSILGGQFPSASSSEDSEISMEYPRIAIVPVQESGAVNTSPRQTRDSLDMESVQDLRDSSLLYQRSDLNQNENDLHQQVIRTQNDLHQQVIRTHNDLHQVIRTQNDSNYDLLTSGSQRLCPSSFDID
ncbi:uncharacterized protein LOC125672348 [Ostrea edulis]|uniref:uncharacterized protein LOC125672348 n=1 Tax=Ostrea edulis TaxID=37623 RepID=UPI0024AECA24|nr:uncharacterized protein LOC125672348 [Ostrea edulis]XP_056018430.1 uncharacterized protein LOC125672348 [Ostrea edulis]